MTDFQSRESRQWGCLRVEFGVPGGRGFVTLPDKPARDAERPWIWYAPTFFGPQRALPCEIHDWYATRWLRAGIAIGGVDAGEAWGNTEGRAAFTEFHSAAVSRFNLDPKPCMLGQSRGGLFVYNWAAEHPSNVRCIGGIYPVCSVRLPAIQDKICAAYGLPLGQLMAARAQHDPLERLAPLAKAGVPIFHVHGDGDEVVPLQEHSAELAKRYKDLGGRIEVLVIHGKGHEEVKEYFECPELLDFFLRQAGVKKGE